MEPSGNRRRRHISGARGANFGARRPRRKADGASRKADGAILGWRARTAGRGTPSRVRLIHAGVWRAGAVSSGNPAARPSNRKSAS